MRAQYDDFGQYVCIAHRGVKLCAIKGSDWRYVILLARRKLNDIVEPAGADFASWLYRHRIAWQIAREIESEMNP